jgi:hypothetical protein
MEYELGRLQNKDGFRPFSLTIKFNTMAEYRNFHDKILINGILPKTEGFVSHFYEMGHNERDYATGVFEEWEQQNPKNKHS